MSDLNAEEKREYMRIMRWAFPERTATSDKKYRSTVKGRESRKRYAKSEAKKACDVRYVNKNRKKVYAYQIKWRHENPERVRVMSRNGFVKYYSNPVVKKKMADKQREKYQTSVGRAKIIEYVNRRRALKLSRCREDCSSKIALLHLERFCRWCCVKFDENHPRTIDHIIPLSLGGLHAPDNLAACCKSCNSKKGTKLVHEWTWELAA